jgi:hypothetical protein
LSTLFSKKIFWLVGANRVRAKSEQMFALLVKKYKKINIQDNACQVHKQSVDFVVGCQVLNNTNDRNPKTKPRNRKSVDDNENYIQNGCEATQVIPLKPIRFINSKKLLHFVFLSFSFWEYYTTIFLICQ